MGGQQFGAGGSLLDMTPVSTGVLSLDVERGLVEVEAGIQWPALIDALARHAVGDPAEADRRRPPLHRRGALRERPRPRAQLRPFVADVEASSLVDADGEPRACSRAPRTRTSSASPSAATGSSASSTRSRCGWRRGASSSASSSCVRRDELDGRVRRADRRRLSSTATSSSRSIRPRPTSCEAASSPATGPSPDARPLARRAAGALRRRLAPAAPARAHGQVARVRRSTRSTTSRRSGSSTWSDRISSRPTRPDTTGEAGPGAR